jgi:uncharacterized LabA/DUF88 family protein
MSTAILVDGGFFLKRYQLVFGSYPSHPSQATQVAKDLFDSCIKHLYDKDGYKRSLYRIFFYDCPPLDKQVVMPVSRELMDFARTPTYQFRVQLHNELKKLRKLVLRLGSINDKDAWLLNDDPMEQLLCGDMNVDQLKDEHFRFDVRQKGVDMRIGLDIATLALKKQATQIVLIAGNSDFVPAAKLARREGIDFILDPMWNRIAEDLYEHIDGLRSTCPKPAYFFNHQGGSVSGSGYRHNAYEAHHESSGHQRSASPADENDELALGL